MMLAASKDWVVTLIVWTSLFGLLIGLSILDHYVDRRWPLKWRAMKQSSAAFLSNLCRRVQAALPASPTAENNQRDVQRAYVAVLVSAARSGGQLSQLRERALWRIAGRIQAANRIDLNVAQILADPELAPGSVAGSARFAANLLQTSPALTRLLAHDVFSVLFADRPLAESDRTWLREFSQVVPWQDEASTVLMFYDRDPAAPDRPRWLNELGLPADASDDAVRATYRTLAMQFHPDRCAELPRHIRELSEAKMAAINEAYENLIAARTALNFCEPDRWACMTQQTKAAPTTFICKCWLCEEKNRVKPAADLSTTRCGGCSALLGLTFDPSAAASTRAV